VAYPGGVVVGRCHQRGLGSWCAGRGPFMGEHWSMAGNSDLELQYHLRRVAGRVTLAKVQAWLELVRP